MATSCCSAIRNDPVRIAVRIGDEADEELGDRLVASRSIMDLPQVTDQIEGASRPRRCASTRRCSRSARGSSRAR